MPNIENTSPHSLQLPELWKPDLKEDIGRQFSEKCGQPKEKDFTKDPKLGVSQQNSSTWSSYNEAYRQ